MNYASRPWLAVTPWSQVRLHGGAIATVLPYWPLSTRRIMIPGYPPVTFTPEPMAFVEVCEPDTTEALAALAAVFGPLDLVAEWGESAEWARCPSVTPVTVDAHLRDVHRTFDIGTTHHRTRSVNESMHYHWQVHQQQLVHPLPIKHFHS